MVSSAQAWTSVLLLFLSLISLNVLFFAVALSLLFFSTTVSKIVCVALSVVFVTLISIALVDIREVVVQGVNDFNDATQGNEGETFKKIFDEYFAVFLVIFSVFAVAYIVPLYLACFTAQRGLIYITAGLTLLASAQTSIARKLVSIHGEGEESWMTMSPNLTVGDILRAVVFALVVCVSAVVLAIFATKKLTNNSGS